MCVGAIPIGLALRVMTIWGSCVVLRQVSDFYFGDIPAFAVSWISLLCGAAETLTYVCSGIAVGHAAGIPLNWLPSRIGSRRDGTAHGIRLGRLWAGFCWSCCWLHGSPSVVRHGTSGRCRSFKRLESKRRQSPPAGEPADGLCAERNCASVKLSCRRISWMGKDGEKKAGV